MAGALRKEFVQRPEVLRAAGGYIEGDIRISGHPKDQRTFARISGYVEQTDSHAPQVPMLSAWVCSLWMCLCASQQSEGCAQTTVHEALQFSALLRLGEDVSVEQREVRPCVICTPVTCAMWPSDAAQASRSRPCCASCSSRAAMPQLQGHRSRGCCHVQPVCSRGCCKLIVS